jgi:PPOX class probable F420-dependent enzyme
MASAMTPGQTLAFLTEGRRTGKVATVRADGRPHVAPVWFVMDGEDLVFTTGESSVKGRTLRRDPRVAVSVDLEQPPYAFVLLEGSVTMSTDLDEMLPYSIAISRRYVGDEQAEAFGRRNAVTGEVLVRLHPEKVVAVDDMMG